MKHIRAVLPFLILSLCIAGCGGGQTPADLNHIAGQRGLAPNSADTFRFVVMTDRNGGQEVGKWAIAVDEVNRLRPDFVMCIGDLTRGYKENPPLTEQEWNEFREENKALRAPFFFTPGNHDVLGVETRKAYGLRHNVNGAPYYSFDYRGCHFAVIDTTCMIEPKARTPEAPLAGAQWAWLAKDLAAAKGARHTFLLMHHPLWRYSSVWEKLRPMLDPARVTLFAGHTHNLDYSEIDGVPCHTLSVTAAKTSGERARGSFQMYAFVTVDAGRPAVTYMPVGSALPLNAVDLAAEAIAQSAMEDAAMSTLGVSGGRTTLRLSNTSKYPMSCDLRWSGSAADLKAMTQPAETISLSPSGTAERTFEFPAFAGTDSLPKLQLTYSYTINKRLRSATREVPLPVVQEYFATPEGKPELTKTTAMDILPRPSGTIPAPPNWRVTYDKQNLYVDVTAVDEKIVTEGKEPWQRDGIEIFWDPRPADQQDGPFAGDCRQVLLAVPDDGEPVKVQTNPKDGGLVEAVKAECLRGKAGYRIIATIPLASIAKDFTPGPGKSLRMDLYQDDKNAPDGQLTVTSVSGKPESSRKTAHYVIVRFK